MKKRINMIVACDENYGIGYKGNLLVHIPEDMKRFKNFTMNNVVVMGRKTLESLPKGYLPNRKNIVLTNNPKDFIKKYGLEETKLYVEKLRKIY